MPLSVSPARCVCVCVCGVLHKCLCLSLWLQLKLPLCIMHFWLSLMITLHFQFRVATLLSPWEWARHKLHIWTAIYDLFRQNGCSLLRFAGVAKGGEGQQWEGTALAHIKSKFTHKYSHINGYSFRQTHRLNWNAARLSGCLPAWQHAP